MKVFLPSRKNSMRKNCAIITSGLSVGFAVLCLFSFSFFFMQECCGPHNESPAERNDRMHKEKEVLMADVDEKTALLNAAQKTQIEMQQHYDYVSGYTLYSNAADEADLNNGKPKIEVDLAEAATLLATVEDEFFGAENTKNYYVDARNAEVENIAKLEAEKAKLENNVMLALESLSELSSSSVSMCSKLASPMVFADDCFDSVAETEDEDGEAIAATTVAVEDNNPMGDDRIVNERQACVYQQWRVRVTECKVLEFEETCGEMESCLDFNVVVPLQSVGVEGVATESETFTSVSVLDMKIANLGLKADELDAKYDAAQTEYDLINNLDTSTAGVGNAQNELSDSNAVLRSSRHAWGKSQFELVTHIANMKGGRFVQKPAEKVGESDSNFKLITKKGHWYASGAYFGDKSEGAMGVAEHVETGDTYTVSTFYSEVSDKTEFMIERVEAPSTDNSSRSKGWTADLYLKLGLLKYKPGVCTYQVTSSYEDPSWRSVIPEESEAARKLMAAMMEAAAPARKLNTADRPMDCYDRMSFLYLFGIGGLTLLVIAICSFSSSLFLSSYDSSVEMHLPGVREARPQLSLYEREQRIKRKITKKYQDKFEEESAKMSYYQPHQPQLVGNPHVVAQQPGPFGLR